MLPTSSICILVQNVHVHTSCSLYSVIETKSVNESCTHILCCCAGNIFCFVFWKKERKIHSWTIVDRFTVKCFWRVKRNTFDNNFVSLSLLLPPSLTLLVLLRFFFSLQKNGKKYCCCHWYFYFCCYYYGLLPFTGEYFAGI